MGKQTAKMQEENLWKDPASGPKRTIPVHIVRLYPRNKKIETRRLIRIFEIKPCHEKNQNSKQVVDI